MNSLLAELLENRRRTVTELGCLLSDGLDILNAEGNDWICGRGGSDSVAVLAQPLADRLPMLLDELRKDWKADTERYRTLLAAYTAERENLFKRDTRMDWGGFAADWCAIRDGCLSEGRWELLRDRLANSQETASFLELFDSLHRISRGTGALRNRIRSRAAENRMARELSDRFDLRISALRGAAYEDIDWGEAVIAAMDAATRNDFRATLRRWQENCALAEKRKQAYLTYSAMYHTYTE